MKQVFIQEELAQGNDVSSLSLQRVLSLAQIERETAIMSSLHHSNVVQYIGWGTLFNSMRILYTCSCLPVYACVYKQSTMAQPHTSSWSISTSVRSASTSVVVLPSYTGIHTLYTAFDTPLATTRLLRDFGPFTEAVARAYTRQLLTGVAYLHAQRIAHRDLKCANLLLSDDGILKITDFGTAKRANDCGNEQKSPQQQRLETARCAFGSKSFA